MKRVAFLSVVLILSSVCAQVRSNPNPASEDPRPARILLVMAHPDDEYDMAATVYRITTELHGVADEIIITDGEAGYHYSSLAERYYGVALTDGSANRARLAQIRVEESRRAAKVLGIRHQWFVAERNIPFTQSADKPLHTTWHTKRILQTISQRIRELRYDFVFVLLPEPQTHGEHKAATILTLQAVESLPGGYRPIVLGAAAGNTTHPQYKPVAGQSLTQTLTIEPEFDFDRNTHFGYEQSLSYQIVVDWLIAEHKSQGLFQTKCLQDRYENFWIFGTEVPEAVDKAAALFAALSQGSSVNGQKQNDEPSQMDSQN
jgi:N-acetylglucosamine malate deacetylase 2